MSKKEQEQEKTWSKKEIIKACVLVGLGAASITLIICCILGQGSASGRERELEELINKLQGKLELLEKENTALGRLINELLYQLGKKAGLENIKKLRK